MWLSRGGHLAALIPAGLLLPVLLPVGLIRVRRHSMVHGTPKEWLSWLLSDDDALVKKARLALGGTSPGKAIPVEPLIAGVRDSNSDVAFWSLAALSGLSHEASGATGDVISFGCTHRLLAIRQASATALSRIAVDDRAATTALLKMLNDDEALVRRQALQALISMKTLCETDLARIAAMRSDRDPSVARWAEIAQRNIASAV